MGPIGSIETSILNHLKPRGNAEKEEGNNELLKV
jgi:hypothetical protein